MLAGSDPPGNTYSPGTVLGRTTESSVIVPVPSIEQRIAQAGGKLQTEELTQPRPAEVAIDQQHTPSDFRQADTEICHRGCFACLGAGAGHQNHPRTDSVDPAQENRGDRGPISIRHHGFVLAPLHHLLVDGCRLGR